ncbi:MAG: hypothetical protein EA396_11725 [Anaerolineaceae bacterium]|nr:MAG: hypothetical protein EA396_11725 [Anaerolineaceae bacterium]
MHRKFTAIVLACLSAILVAACDIVLVSVETENNCSQVNISYTLEESLLEYNIYIINASSGELLGSVTDIPVTDASVGSLVIQFGQEFPPATELIGVIEGGLLGEEPEESSSFIFSCSSRDGRVNFNQGFGDPAIVYAPQIRFDEQGVEVFMLDENGNGQPVFRLTLDEITAIMSEETISENQLVAASDDNFIEFYRLTTGEIQVNMGPDFEGKTFVYVLSVPDFRVTNYYTFK